VTTGGYWQVSHDAASASSASGSRAGARDSSLQPVTLCVSSRQLTLLAVSRYDADLYDVLAQHSLDRVHGWKLALSSCSRPSPQQQHQKSRVATLCITLSTSPQRGQYQQQQQQQQQANCCM